ncbi:MAG: leucine-rich repeat protein [Ruminococcus sp.]|nr:leucine-rich repeat protein [Ruminococcus sp.]
MQDSDSMFYVCEKLTSVKIPDSVWHINSYAFYDSGNL